MKNLIDELTGYRVKVEKDGKEIVNVPGILALPGLLIAPKASIIGMVAAPLLGCSIHLENEDGKKVDIGKAVKDAAETVVDTAASAAKTVREEIGKAWDAMSADDPEACPEGKENEEEPVAGNGAEACPESKENEEAPAEESAAEGCSEGAETGKEAEDRKAEEKDVPVIHVESDGAEKA